MKTNYILRLVISLMSACLALALPADSYGYNPSKYAASSVLASGNWARVKVNTTGMQFISNAQLAQLGFKRPADVNVYGYGGRMIKETLSSSMPDDLPLLPCVHTAAGIFFYGVDFIDWQTSTTASSNGRRWSHIWHPYSEASYYFLSDRQASPELPAADTSSAPEGTPVLTTFTARAVHETENFAPSTTGRNLLGEDLRSSSGRRFTIQTPDISGSTVKVLARLGTNSSASSTIEMTLAGSDQSARTTLPATNSSNFVSYTMLETEFETDAASTVLQLDYSSSGAIKFARLDYIEVEWERKMRLRDGQLHFYLTNNRPYIYQIEGCTDQTRLWDVTDPAAPKQMETTFSGGKLTFTSAGHREFIAFNTDRGLAVEVAGQISNQDIHALPVPDMLIITPPEFMGAARRVAALHETTDGMTVHVLTPAQLYNEFSSGNPDVSAFRKALKMWYDRGNAEPEGTQIKYCLIMSRPTFDNKLATEVIRAKGYPLVPIWQSSTGTTESSSFSTDDFIGMLEDSSGTSLGAARINVAVGRMPAISVAEAEAMVTKLENYIKNPNLASWRNSVMLIADDQDSGIHLQQSENMFRGHRSSGNGFHFFYDRVYLDSYIRKYSATGPVYPEAKNRIIDNFNKSMWIDYIGHANPASWTHENLLTWNDITSFSNTNLPILYAATCEFNRWDAEDRSGAEEMWANPSGGVIAMICPSRTVYITQNGTLSNSVSKLVFKRDEKGLPYTLGRIYAEGKNGCPNDDNKLRFTLMGDPAMRIPSPIYNVELQHIDNVDLSTISDPADYPVLKARQKVKLSGRITRDNGTRLTDFNGTLEFRLFDAEKPIVTKGNGAEGEVMTYNDHNTQLVLGAVTVKEGIWETEVVIPSEIENNYAAARLTMYAVADDKREANGASEEFYIYGFDNKTEPDTEGPRMEYFALNRTPFTDGTVVNSTPMAIAKFSDPSGINVSDAGIGHKMMLVLDDEKYFDDVNSYFTPDPFDRTSGTIAYPMPEISPGEHTLTLSVWDNVNNNTKSSVTFNVSVSKQPDIFELTTDCNPAKTAVVFRIATDSPRSRIDCLIEVFDLDGRRVWSSQTDGQTDMASNINVAWNLTDRSGVRVERGIYLYRATLTGPSGSVTTRTSRLAVTAP